MRITVILCTYNRCRSLAKALNSVAKSVMPSSAEWDVLVVDNNSKDETKEVIEMFRERFPGRFRYVFEARQGKSHALNAGIGQASGDVLAFMDDDVEVDPHWLNNLTTPLLCDEWAGAGGRILPESGFVRQPWMDTNVRHGLAPLAMFDMGTEPSELKESPFGTNMAFRKEMFAKHGNFRIDLGPQPGSQIRSEDSEFGGRLLAAGERLRYEPSAIVYHAVPEDRASRKYFQAWWFGKGRADVREFGVSKDTRWYVGGVPLYLLRRLTVWSLKFAICAREPERFSRKLKAYWIAGIILECHKRAHRT